ncbi:MAG: OmpA family protein [Woeseia sp.]
MSDLDDLKTLLFGAEKEVLDSIQQRVQLPEARAADVAAVLPEAIRLRHREDGELVESLREPVGRCMRDSIRKSPEEFADALYPVMGPAIRKSIAHALKAFSDQINRTLEHSLSVKGLRWRMQAARAGIPFSSYVIQQSLLYRVEQAYLISRENGLLISHVHHDASRIKDSDAVSAMFTAIQDFVKESFSPDRSGRLETADMGEFTLWAVHGPHALLVCVIRGVPPRALRNDLSRVLERLHFRFGEALREYQGDTSTVSGIEEELQRCLLFEATKPVAGDKKKLNWPLIIVGGLVIAACCYAMWVGWQHAQQRSRLEATLATTPGIYVAQIEEDDGRYILQGLRDPLAEDLPAIAERAGLLPDQLRSELRPYRSLDADIVLRRIRKLLEPEAGINIALIDGAIVVSGTASPRWVAGARQQAATLDLGWPVTFENIQFAGWQPLVERASALDGATFYFANNAELASESVARLATFGENLRQLAADAHDVGATLQVQITGHTDGIGSRSFNDRLANDRAAVVFDALRNAGVEPSLLATGTSIPRSTDADADPQQRRSIVKITLTPPGP